MPAPKTGLSALAKDVAKAQKTASRYASKEVAAESIDTDIADALTCIATSYNKLRKYLPISKK